MQVVGQPEAVKSVTNAIQLSRTGLNNANRPIASLLFTGPSGTGKTLLSKAVWRDSTNVSVSTNDPLAVAGSGAVRTNYFHGSHRRQ